MLFSCCGNKTAKLEMTIQITIHTAVRKVPRNTFKRLLIISSVYIFVIGKPVIHHFTGHRKLENSTVTDALYKYDLFCLNKAMNAMENEIKTEKKSVLLLLFSLLLILHQAGSKLK